MNARLPAQPYRIMRAVGMTLLASLLVSAASTIHAAGSTGRQALTTSHLRVCADPANLPFSDDDLDGFENRVIELLADELDRDVRYTWYPQSTGFVRNTLRLRACDLISGITTTSEKVQNTNPYYHSTYTLVHRGDAAMSPTRIADLADVDGEIGVIAGTPPSDVLAREGLLPRVRPYQLITDTRVERPAIRALQDVADGETVAALVWGPIAGWYARQNPDADLVVVPLLDEPARMNFHVSMAVRYNETDWKRTVNRALDARRDEIDAVLRDYGIPLLDERGRPIADP